MSTMPRKFWQNLVYPFRGISDIIYQLNYLNILLIHLNLFSATDLDDAAKKAVAALKN